VKIVVILLVFFPCLVSAVDTADEEIRKKIVNKSLDSLVSIYVNVNEDGDAERHASGFVIDDGYVVTNYHVIRGSENIYIKPYINSETVFSDKSKKNIKSNVSAIYGDKIKIHKADIVRDIALLKVSGLTDPDNKKTIKLSSIPAKLAENIIIVSNPGGLKGFVAEGIISLKDKANKLMSSDLMTDALKNSYSHELLLFNNIIKGGSSGSAIIDWPDGNVIGVASGAISNEFAGFGVPAEFIKKLISPKGSLLSFDYAAAVKQLKSNEGVAAEYLDDVIKYSNDMSKNTITFEGTIVNRSSIELSDVWVNLSTVEVGDKKSEVSMVARTNNKGHFIFVLPKIKQKKWKIEIVAFKYKNINEEIGFINDHVFKNYDLVMRDKYSKKGLRIIVRPGSFGMEKQNGRILKIKSYKYVGQRRENFKAEWKVCSIDGVCAKSRSLPEWLHMPNMKGEVENKWLDVEINKKNLNETDDLYRLFFLAESTNLSNSVKSHRVFIKPDNNNLPVVLQGYIVSKEKETLEDGNLELVAFYAGSKKFAEQAVVNDDGYFFLSFYPTEKDNQLVFSLDSDLYKIKDNKNVSYPYDGVLKLKVERVPASE